MSEELLYDIHVACFTIYSADVVFLPGHDLFADLRSQSVRYMNKQYTIP